MTIVEFLRARFAEDEYAAKRAGDDHPVWRYDRELFEVFSVGGWTIASRAGRDSPRPLCDVDGEHIARHGPARVLADVEAKRRIVDLHEGSHECSVYDHNGDVDNCHWCVDSADCSTLRLLALPYVDHPDYNSAWSVT